MEATNPVTQLLGEMIAAACLNARETGRNDQRIHGCFTVADTWTFVRVNVGALDTERPTFSMVSSPEICEKSGAARIVKILKSIMAEHRQRAG